MRKLLMFNLLTLDGFFEGMNHDIRWHNVDAEFNDYAVEMLNSVDILIFGRVTYELMASYWPSVEAVKDDPLVADRMNNLDKVVFSRTLDRATWNRTRLAVGDLAEEVGNMKRAPGKDMAVLGSGSIVTQLAEQGLIDEYRIMLNPVVLGGGTPLFKGLRNRMEMKLTSMKAMQNGNVLLFYLPERRKKGTRDQVSGSRTPAFSLS